MAKMKGLRTSDGRLAAIAAREHGNSITALTTRLQPGWTVNEACEVSPGGNRRANQQSDYSDG